MPTILDRLHMVARTSACIVAGIPTTTIPPLPLTLALTKRYHREDRLRRLHRMVSWARFCRERLLKIDLSVVGREHLPSPSRGHFFVSNHQSWVDILVLLEVLDSGAFLSKDSVKKIPVMGRAAYAAGTIYVDRDEAGSRQKALLETLRMCKESTGVVIFPEGTRSPDGEIRNKIHPAILKVAYEQKLNVIPLALDGTFFVLPKTMDQVHLGQKVQVNIGSVMRPDQFSDAKTWSNAIWDEVKLLFSKSRAFVRSDQTT